MESQNYWTKWKGMERVIIIFKDEFPTDGALMKFQEETDSCLTLIGFKGTVIVTGRTIFI